MQISKEKKEEMINTITEAIKTDTSLMVGSLTKYNLSNVNHIRKLHLIKDPERHTIYCKDNEIARGYIRPFVGQSGKFLIPSYVSEYDLCRRCVNKFVKERYAEKIEKLKSEK